ncbi:MAG: hypothetical protein M0Q92_07580 [Methanoregula sp.]|jgi:hypothetical protein|nr:hypothetical protein [Methanoregula sp.]
MCKEDDLMETPANPGNESPAYNPAIDIPLFRSPRNSPDSNTPVRRGTDLYVHRIPSGRFRFTIRDWSEIPGEDVRCITVSEEFAIFFLQDVSCRRECIAGIDHEQMMKYLPNLYGGGKQ